MDKYEFNIKAEQLKKQVKAGDYETAQKICDSIDWRRVNNVSLLSMVASVYEHNKDYDEAKEILLLAYEKAPIGKRLLYKLSTLALRQGNVAEAEEYYKEFYDLAKDDPRQHILRYLILKAKGAPATHLISSLEAYNRTELDERWMYELAELYHKAGMSDECVAMCDKIMLMFGIGQYVNKAIYLKTVMEGRELNEYQKTLVDNRDQYEFYSDYDEQTEDAGTGEKDADAASMSARRKQDLELEEAGIAGQGATGTLPRLNSEMETSGVMYQYDDTQDVPENERTRVLDDINTVLPNTKQWQEIEEETAKEREAVRQAAKRQVDEAMEQAKEAAKAAAQARAAARAASEARANAEAQAAELQTAAAGISQQSRQEEEHKEVMYTVNFLVARKNDGAGLEAAIKLLRLTHEKTGSTNQVTKIKGEKLNQRGVANSVSKLEGKDLIVEDAGDLSTQSVNELIDMIYAQPDKRVVVLIDNHMQIERLKNRYSELMKLFYVDDEEAAGNESAPESRPTAGSENPAAGGTAVKGGAATVDEALTENAGRESSREAYSYAGYLPASGLPAGAAGDGRDRSGYEQKKDARSSYEETGATIIGQEETYRPRQAAAAGSADDGMRYGGAAAGPEGTYGSAGKGGGAGAQMDIDEFAKYCQEYAASIDCTIPGKSLLALYERIEIMEEDGIPLTKESAVDLIEETADKAENPSLGKKLTGMFSPRYDKEGLLILKEENFLP